MCFDPIGNTFSKAFETFSPKDSVMVFEIKVLVKWL